LRQRKAALLRQAGLPLDLLRGSFIERFTTGGKPHCACVRDQKHGPFHYLTAHLGAGRNHAFNELTAHSHLTHCPHHEPVAILAWLLIRVLGFNLFELFVRLHGKLWRLGRVTLQEVALQLDRALEAFAEWQPLWSG